MGPIVEERASFAGIATRLLRVDGPAPPLVLLHGFSDSADTFRPLLQLLAGEHAAVAVDLPGFGRAGRPPPGGSYLEAVDRFVAELVRGAAEDGPVVLSGNSLGGVAALRAAHDASVPLAGIAPISPGGLGHAPWVDMISREPLLHRLVQLPIPLPMPFVRRLLAGALARLAYADRRRAEPEVLRRYASHYTTRDQVLGIVPAAWRLLAELRGGYADLASISCPVLLIWGARDRLVPVAGAQLVLTAVPNSRLVELADVGHCAHAEDPRAVARLLLEFDASCRELAAAGAPER
jgi:pimeloyl-ACP methyl ester carboxylesterase